MIWLFYVFVLLLPFQEHYLWNSTIGPLTVIKALGLVLLLLAVLRALVHGMPRLWNSLTANALFFFVVWRALSYVFADYAHGGESIFTTPGVANATSALMLLFVALVMLDSEEKLRRTMLMCIGSMGIAGLYIIRQYLGGDLRPGWPFGDPNYYALYAMMAVPIAFGVLRTEKRKLYRLGYYGCIALCLTGLLLCGSRSGFVTLMLFAVVTAAREKGTRQKVLLAGLVAASLLAAPTAIQRITNPTHSDLESNYLHVAFAKAAFAMMLNNPMLGVGPSAAYFKAEIAGYTRSFTGVAHNTYLEIGAESGLPALAAYLLIIFSAWLSLRRSAKEYAALKHAYLESLARSLQFSLVSFCLIGMTVSGSYIRFAWFVFFLAVVLQQKRFLKEEPQPATAPATALPRGQVFLRGPGPRFPLPNPGRKALAIRRPRLTRQTPQR